MRRLVRRTRSHRLATGLSTLAALGSVTLGSIWRATDDPAPLDFGRDIRPLLSDNCFACHGPDEETREANLRLDLREQAFGDLGGYAAFVADRPDESEAFLRISDASDPMPPHDSGKSLSADEIALVRRWIEQGAEWEEHWAYRPVVRPDERAIELPALDAWSLHPIDRFLRARQIAEGLEHEERASRETLIRRASLDLTGLPPSIEEVDRFLADDADGAYGRLLDRLLDSPAYGEHMARSWLDAARYGDTHGFHLDNEREIWPYRDWVINAFNRNMPFDRFTIEQLAGDLLPDATRAQRIATGFNRCNPTSAEGGMIEEEYLAKYAADRAVTTAEVWMGTTLLCAQCHDHKFDPIAQGEFYELFAFFNSVDESASDENGLAPPPVLMVPDDVQARRLAELDSELEELRASLDAPLPVIDAAQGEWEAEWTQRIEGRWFPLEITAAETNSNSTLRELDDGSVLAEGDQPPLEFYEVTLRTELDTLTAIRLDALPHESLGHEGVGRAFHANIVLSGFELEVADGDGTFRRVPFAVATADYEQDGFAILGAIDEDNTTGWANDGLPGPRTALFALAQPLRVGAAGLVRVRLRFESEYERHQLGRFRLRAADANEFLATSLGNWHVAGPFQGADDGDAFARDFGPEAGVDLDAHYGDGALGWERRDDLGDGALHSLTGEHCATYAYRTLEAPSDRTLTLALGSDDAIKVWLNGALVFELNVARSAALDQDFVELALDRGTNHLLLKVVNFADDYAFAARRADEAVGGIPIEVELTLAQGAEADEPDIERVRSYFRRTRSPDWRALLENTERLEVDRSALVATIPTTLVMRETDEPRAAHVLLRGLYDRKGAEVRPGTPDFLPPLSIEEGARATRLDLARWLVEPTHPLTARVAVNRLWQELFGTGIVATAEDFGAQGEWPSHPELLDWLAAEFVASGWDVKHMLRLIATSEAYRQRVRSGPEDLARDPRNRLLARGARFRMDAERIRDTALATSGLLVRTIGGPSVRPYQPEGVWSSVAYVGSNTAKFEAGEGDALYRRSLYTFWKRTAPPPMLQLFDAPSRESCTIARARTNTPLQALALMNDVQFVEAARAFAAKIIAARETDDERIVYAFRAATARAPTAREVEVLTGLLRAELDAYAAAPDTARELIATGASAVPEGVLPVELAAWTHVASVLLNLDEVVTKG